MASRSPGTQTTVPSREVPGPGSGPVGRESDTPVEVGDLDVHRRRPVRRPAQHGPPVQTTLQGRFVVSTVPRETFTVLFRRK